MSEFEPTDAGPRKPEPTCAAEGLSDSINRLAAAIERLVDRMEQDAEFDVPFVIRPPSPKGSRLRGR